MVFSHLSLQIWVDKNIVRYTVLICLCHQSKARPVAGRSSGIVSLSNILTYFEKATSFS